MFHKGMTGRTDENGPASVKNDIGKRGGQELYLRDYITRKQESDALFTGESMTTQPQPEALRAALAEQAGERERFEAVMRSETFDTLERVSDGTYKSYEARVAWICWQARASFDAPAAEQAEPVAWEYRATYIPNPHLDDGMRVCRDRRVAEVNGDPDTIKALSYAAAPPAPAADAMHAGWREVIADVAADISDHPSLAHEKLRRLLAAPPEGGAA